MTRHRRRTGLFWAAALLALAASPAALAQQAVDPGAVSRVTTEISREIYSPFCPGKTLAMCPSSAAADVRREIQAMAEAGQNKQEIKDAILAQYGEEFRQVEPPLLDEITLLALLALGLIVALLAIAYLSRRRPAATPLEAAPDEPRPHHPGERDGTVGPEDQEYLNTLRDEYLG